MISIHAPMGVEVFVFQYGQRTVGKTMGETPVTQIANHWPSSRSDGHGNPRRSPWLATVSLLALAGIAGELGGCATSSMVQSESLSSAAKPVDPKSVHKGYIQYSLAESAIVVTASTDSAAPAGAKTSGTSDASANTLKIDLTLSAASTQPAPAAAPAAKAKTGKAASNPPATPDATAAATKPTPAKTDETSAAAKSAPDLCGDETSVFNTVLGHSLQIRKDKLTLLAKLRATPAKIATKDRADYITAIDSYAKELRIDDDDRQHILPPVQKVLGTTCAPVIKITLAHAVVPALGPGYLLKLRSDALYADTLGFKVDSKTGLLTSATTTSTDKTPDIVASVVTTAGEVAGLTAGGGVPGVPKAVNLEATKALPVRATPKKKTSCADLVRTQTEPDWKEFADLAAILDTEKNCLNQDVAMIFEKIAARTANDDPPVLPVVKLPPPRQFRLSDILAGKAAYSLGTRNYTMKAACVEPAAPTNSGAPARYKIEDGVLSSRSVGCNITMEEAPATSILGYDLEASPVMAPSGANIVAQVEIAARDPSIPVLVPLERMQWVTRKMGYGFTDGAVTSASDQHDSPIAVAAKTVAGIPGDFLDGITGAFKKKSSEVDAQAGLQTSLANLYNAETAAAVARASAGQAATAP
jgi:hypothetical protein